MKISSTQLSLASQMVEVPTEIAEATWDVNIQLRGDAIGCKSLGDSKAVHFLNTADPSLISTYTTTNGAAGNDSNLLIVFYVQIMPDDFVMQLHRF
ncbi:hypothetical protein VEE17_34950 [Escherichia coli]|nr:hypothetical protein VEE41_14110 [Escherichia coli]BEB64170.1 hypothetical protein VEE17_34950 [Escherichia coli]